MTDTNTPKPSGDITLHLSPQMLDIVANALGHRPYIESAPVLDELRKQVAAYNATLPTTAPGADAAAPLQ